MGRVGFGLPFGTLTILSIGAPIVLLALVALVIGVIGSIPGASAWTVSGLLVIAVSGAALLVTRAHHTPWPR